MADWAQSRNVAANGLNYIEMNPLMGRHPSVDTVDVYFIGTATVLGLATHYLPSKWRKRLLTGWVVVGGISVGNNINVGVGFGF